MITTPRVHLFDILWFFWSFFFLYGILLAESSFRWINNAGVLEKRTWGESGSTESRDWFSFSPVFWLFLFSSGSSFFGVSILLWEGLVLPHGSGLLFFFDFGLSFFPDSRLLWDA